MRTSRWMSLGGQDTARRGPWRRFDSPRPAGSALHPLRTKQSAPLRVAA